MDKFNPGQGPSAMRTMGPWEETAKSSVVTSFIKTQSLQVNAHNQGKDPGSWCLPGATSPLAKPLLHRDWHPGAAGKTESEAHG